jgi:hypothetical protein
MTIRRQYSLPNCSLILDGWTGEMALHDGGNGRPQMSIVVSAECRFTSQEHQSSVLQGDRDFLESLVRVVNNYAQSVLSGIGQQPTQDWVGEVVNLEPLPEKNRHRLQFTRTKEGKPEEIIKVDLTTLELFDLVEAIDQLLKDGSTLPELTLSIKPHSYAIRRREEPLRKRAQPALAGVASLAVAAIALLFVPIPEPREAETRESSQSRREETLPNENSSNNLVPPGIKKTLADTPRITASEELTSLAETVQTTVDENWEQRGLVEQPLTYRVWVTPNGEILGYEQLSGRNRNITETPALPDLLSLPSTGRNPQPQAVAELEVTFNPNGVVAVKAE